MSKAQFTPGPWTVNSCGYVGTAPKTDNDTGWTLIACPAELHGPTSYVRLPDAKEQACNARLIAAAPDLLAALEECITNEGAHCLAYGADTPTLRARLASINRTARAALAKAKGE